MLDIKIGHAFLVLLMRRHHFEGARVLLMGGHYFKGASAIPGEPGWRSGESIRLPPM